MPPVQITAKCKIVTPMLSSGENQQKFEIRAAEIKAGLRFWWRAFQPDNGNDLFKKEKDLFGSTEKTSPFSFYVSYNNESISKYLPGDCHDWGEGIQYCLFSINKPAQKEIKPGGSKAPRPYKSAQIKPSKDGGRPVAKPGGEFTINFIFKNNADEKIIGDIICALWLLENFGGLGGRTRRGAGCFQISNDFLPQIKMNCPNLSADFFNNIPKFIPTDESIEKFLESGLNKILKRWKTETRKCKPEHSAYDSTLAEPQILIMYSDNIAFPVDIMEIIGKQMQNFCYTYPYHEAKIMHTTLVSKSSLPPYFNLNKTSKGLPIIYNFSKQFERLHSGRLEFEYIATSVECDDCGRPKPDQKSLWKEGGGRRSSPLVISYHRKKKVSYAAICFFPTTFLPGNQKIGLIARKEKRLNDKKIKSPVIEKSKILDPPDYSFVNDMLFNTVKYDANGNEKIKLPIIKKFSRCFRLLPSLEEIKGVQKKVESESKKSLDKKSKTTKPVVVHHPKGVMPDDPNEIKKIYLSKAPPRNDGLKWFLAEIIKIQQDHCSCILWSVENEVLRKDDREWSARTKQLNLAPGLKRDIGTFFLCTKQPDNRTQNSKNYLYNITLPKRIV